MAKDYLEPIHGISLRDYAAMAKRIAQGVDEEPIFRAMGIDRAIWDEINTLWPQRMAEDETFEVTILYSQYFADETPHPKLDAVKADISAEGAANLERVKADRYFYEELSGAREAAFEYGLDGSQWLLETFGINLADFQAAAMKHGEENFRIDPEQLREYLDYQCEMKAKYAEKFAAERGGNVADDVEF
ncbi:MAG: hypothetical protein LBO81_06090 [Clostridiales Family XIII bacterium]|jgi:hypothetical protein|nr:hypothetical protein [Clostridiales Family XIII bacterium]